MKLYEITEQHRQLEKLVEDGEFSDEMVADTFASIEGAFEDKALSLIHVVSNMEADMEAIDSQIKRLQDMKKVRVNKRESLREYLRFNMEASSITKIDCPLFNISLRKGRDIVEINDPDKIPDDFVTPVVDLKIDKPKLLKALKEGSVAGASLVKSKSSLFIK